MISAISKYTPGWLTAMLAVALVLGLLVGSSQNTAQAIDPGETDIAYVADGYNFPDALMGATLAGLNTAPMLGVRGPTTGDVVPPETAAELDRLTNNKASPLDTIYVFGGPAAVSDKVVGELGAWANNVTRIAGANRFATMKEISEALPSQARDSDLLDGMDSTQFLGATDKAVDSDLLDGMDSTQFLGATDKAADADLLDGQDSTAFAERLWAVVNDDGTLARGERVTSAGNVGTGNYEVIFDRDVTGCSYTATIGNPGTGTPLRGFIVTAARAGEANGVFVATSDVSDAFADRPFHLQVIC